MPRLPEKRPPGKRPAAKPFAGKPAGGGKPSRGKPPAGKRSGPPQRRPRPAATPQGNGADDRDGDRLQKVLAAAGLASRRECEQFILEGRVQIDGEVVTELGTKVDRQRQEIRVDGEPLPRTRLQYFAVHKPTGVVSTLRDPAGRPRVIDLLPPGVGRMFNVGRLDLASEGLIIVTNDGPLSNQLTHPRHGVEKIYEVLVAGQPDADVIAQMQKGVHLSEGFVHAVAVRVKSSKKGSTLLEMVLDEGRNREIRRLLARLGHKVQRLTRIAVGPIRLGELPRGAVRLLTHEEVKKLREVAAHGSHPEGREHPAAASTRPPRPRRTGGAPPKRSAIAAAGKPIGRKPTGRQPLAKKPPAVVPPETARRIIGDESAPARPAAAKPPRPGTGKPARPGRPGAFKRKSGPQKGHGGQKRSGKR